MMSEPVLAAFYSRFTGSLLIHSRRARSGSFINLITSFPTSFATSVLCPSLRSRDGSGSGKDIKGEEALRMPSSLISEP